MADFVDQSIREASILHCPKYTLLVNDLKVQLSYSVACRLVYLLLSLALLFPRRACRLGSATGKNFIVRHLPAACWELSPVTAPTTESL